MPVPIDPERLREIATLIRTNVDKGAKPKVGFYTLDAGGSPRLEPDPRKWAVFMVHGPIHVAQDLLPDGTYLSTAFCGASVEIIPQLWETMIISGVDGEMVFRYWPSASAAMVGHRDEVRARTLTRAIRLSE